MTDELREKVRRAIDARVMEGATVSELTDAIMDLIGGVEDDLIERLAVEADRGVWSAVRDLDGVNALSGWLRSRKGGA